MDKNQKIAWLAAPEEHNYPAAFSYLSLFYDAKTASDFVKKLRLAPISTFKAKDIFRASRLSLLGVSNAHVKKNQKKIRAGIKLSPVLLIRNKNNSEVIIADGYHRVCSAYSFDEDVLIPCKIV